MSHPELTVEQREGLGHYLAGWDSIRYGKAPLIREVEPALAPPSAEPQNRFLRGDKFILDAPDQVLSIWGRDDQVLWADGEPLLIVGADGVGKGTIAQQLALGRVGLEHHIDFLGQPVSLASHRVLYVAADRPHQIARSFKRMVGEDDRAALHLCMTVWKGPLPFDLGSEPDELVPWLEGREIDTVILDSLGALVRDPASDEAGSGVFRALMSATAEGYQVAALYHPRKPEQGAQKRVQTVADVYGSRWITAAAGSVLYLDGQPGDLIINARHLKQPASEVGPLTLKHDHEAGRTELFETPDLLDLAATGVTVRDAAESLFETSTPTRNEIEKTRRRLDQLADRGDLERVPASNPTIYRGSR